MQSAADIRLIFSNAIANKTADRAVSVRAIQLVIALGAAVASLLVGRELDLEQLKAQLQDARKRRLKELFDDVEKHRYLAQLGVTESRVKMERAQKSITAVQSGRWVPQDLVTVNVGQLREALAEFTDEAQDDESSDEDDETGFRIPDMGAES